MKNNLKDLILYIFMITIFTVINVLILKGIGIDIQIQFEEINRDTYIFILFVIFNSILSQVATNFIYKYIRV